MNIAGGSCTQGNQLGALTPKIPLARPMIFLLCQESSIIKGERWAALSEAYTCTVALEMLTDEMAIRQVLNGHVRSALALNASVLMSQPTRLTPSGAFRLTLWSAASQLLLSYPFSAEEAFLQLATGNAGIR